MQRLGSLYVKEIGMGLAIQIPWEGFLTLTCYCRVEADTQTACVNHGQGFAFTVVASDVIGRSSVEGIHGCGGMIWCSTVP